jgi:signal transduction histidine kinase
MANVHIPEIIPLMIGITWRTLTLSNKTIANAIMEHREPAILKDSTNLSLSAIMPTTKQ